MAAVVQNLIAQKHTFLMCFVARKIKEMKAVNSVAKRFNPPSASFSCDARMGGCRMNPCSPYIRHPPIKRHLLLPSTSHWCISPIGIQVQMNSFYAKLTNPLNASCSCDVRIGGYRQNRLLVPHSPFSQHPPIKDTPRQSEPLITAFHPGYQRLNELFHY